MAELSPMMKQYLAIKDKHKDAIVFFRLGDFYEMFFDDAVIASKELELTLTGRDCGQEERAPMCGVPYHSYEGYVAKLVAKGHKVAICEQTEDPSQAKGIVKRDIIRVITPGTVMESSMLDEGKNNFICSMFISENEVGICFCDISTGELYASQINDSIVDKVRDELSRFSPSEILVGGEIDKISALKDFIKDKLKSDIEMLDDEKFDFYTCVEIVTKQFKGKTLDSLGVEDKVKTVCCIGALIDYLKKTQITGLERITNIEIYSESQFMRLDYNSKRNLELTETMRNKEKKGSLLWVLDKTKTSMGKRLIRSWLEQPLLSCGRIINRQNAVEELYSDKMLCDELTDTLSDVFDMERIMTKIVYGSANGRELRALCSTLKQMPNIKNAISNCKSQLLESLHNDIDLLEDVVQIIDNAIVDDPPFTLKDGGIIKKGYNSELDLLKGDLNDGHNIIANIEAEERQKTGIPKLKIGYNKVFGYYIEVTNSYKNLVPDTYIRKQTLSNCERYITEELKNLENRIIGSKEKSINLEYELFDNIRKTVSSQLDRVNKTSRVIAQLDVLASFANVAYNNNYTKPIINLSGKIIIKDGRHPVVESLMKDIPFVANDLILDNDSNRVAIITGPNMAGKSTFMRQNAIIVLMAQIGSFVPASYAEIGITDSIFTRVGASDDLASGQSTFMVEMNEVAYILKNATSRSLLILDEIGRGTSTFDGMSIAKAVLEYVTDKRKLGAKTLFATHYHELTTLGDTVDGIRNYNVAVKKRGDDITFLRRIIKGSADDSYGIDVAKLAGIPNWVINRAKEVLSELESDGKNKISFSVNKKIKTKENEDLPLMALTDSSNNIKQKLKSIDVNTLTPIEAINTLFELVKMVND